MTFASTPGTDDVTERESSELDMSTARGGTPRVEHLPAVLANVPDGTGDNARSRSVTPRKPAWMDDREVLRDELEADRDERRQRDEDQDADRKYAFGGGGSD